MSEILDEEELLTLRLCIDSKWTSKEKGEDDSVSAGNVSSVDSKISRLLEARDKVFGEGCVDIPRYHEESKNVRLVGLLFEAATAVDIHDLSSAIDTLQEIYMSSSLISDPIQRVVAYFADALATRLFPPRSRFYGSMDKICATQEDEFSAFMEFYRVLPFYQFAHFTANQEIIEAFEEEAVINGGRIHVIDFDASYGFQWPSLIQSFSDMATTTTSRTISLTITGYGRNVEELRVTKERLESFANSCANLSFKFKGILTGSSFTSIDVEANSTLVVNLPFYLQTLSSSQETKDTLASVYSMNPSLVVLVEKEGNQRTRSFLPNFMELLYFYTAIFDSLHEHLPLESIERFNIEKNYLGKKIKLEIGQGHIEETFEHDKSWKETMKGFGFEGKKMSSRSLSQAKLLLKIKSPCTMKGDGANCGFAVFKRDEGHEIALTWRDRALVSISCWRRTSW
ncbi:scarecrow-like protein 21 [Carex littledalei]|uniref:Scarecrow-like protein 21 n=1 Tax=Carex littledalei TaxID=544730 RepID=A0A833RA21_9POAL|nr:scarecrow-like protein 21 [Carex littledalei]